MTANCSCCFLHSLKYLTLSTSFPCARTNFLGINFSLLLLVTSLATSWIPTWDHPTSQISPLFVQGDVQRWGKVCTPAGGMLRSGEGHCWKLMGLLRRVGELDGLGRGILWVFCLGGRRWVWVIRVLCWDWWRRGGRWAESLPLVGCTCALFPSLALNKITYQRRRDPPRSIASFNPRWLTSGESWGTFRNVLRN